jgi:hydroxymethylpyrimidine/phosphomethylpyrimidine kinase
VIKTNQYFRVLTIAGSDSGGGAGIQADLKTFASLGCYGMSVITALTAQNTVGVTSIFDVSSEFVGDQFDAVMSDIGTDVIKIGMLHKPEIIELVASKLTRFPTIPVVLDPVMIAKGGAALLQPQAIDALTRHLLPLSTVVTPNIPEASALLRRSLSTRFEIECGARDLLEVTAQGILIKGGHSDGRTSDDCLAYRTGGDVRVTWLDAKRIDTKNTHGTGCSLSSAIAAYMARGLSIEQSVKAAKTYITSAIEAGAEYSLGKGYGPVHHFFDSWE